MAFERQVLAVCAKTLDGDCRAYFYDGTLCVRSESHGVPINTLLHDLHRAGFHYCSAARTADDSGEEWLIDFTAKPTMPGDLA